MDAFSRLLAHVAQVPRLVVVTHHVCLFFWVAQDKAKLMAMFPHPHALLGRVERPPHGVLQRRDVEGKSRLVLTASCAGGISLLVAFVGSYLLLIGAIGRVDHQLGIGLFLALLLHGHEGLNHITECSLLLIAVSLLELHQAVWLVVLVKVMAPVDQHQMALAGVAGNSDGFTVEVAPHVDNGDDILECGQCRIHLVIGEVAIEVLGDEITLAQQGVGDGVVFAAHDE